MCTAWCTGVAGVGPVPIIFAHSVIIAHCLTTNCLTVMQSCTQPEPRTCQMDLKP